MSDLKDYEVLIEQYKTESDRSSFETAVLERKIWSLAEPTIKKADGALRSKREWLASMLSVKPFEVEGRSAVLGYGEAAIDIWRRIDEEHLPLRSATRLLREARERSNISGITVAEAIAKMLADYDQLPTYRTPQGGIAHKRNRGMLPRTPPPVPEPEEIVPGKEDDPKYFWANLRGMISGYFHTRLEGVDQGVVEKVWRELEVELKVLLEHFQHKIDRMRRSGDIQKQSLNRGKILEACHTLNLDPPQLGRPLSPEFKKKAKQHFKKLAARYHPDQSGTNDTRGMYESVVEAWHILEDL